jgi:predicted glycoside hydrolase/deacetylase ChbG (UPF0249 family)
MTRVIINADDYGLHRDINRGIRYCIAEGLINSVSVAMCGEASDSPELDELRSLQQTNPGLRVGVHLMLSDGVPLTGCPSGVDTSGAFLPYVNQVAWRWATGRFDRREIYAEWKAQIERALAAGLRLGHLDSHQHVHLFPGLWRCSVDLASSFGIRRVRTSYESVAGALFPLRPRHVIMQLLARRRHLECPQGGRTLGVLQSGALRFDALRPVLDRELVRTGRFEVMTHRGFESDELRHKFPQWSAQWAAEIDELSKLKQYLGSRREFAGFAPGDGLAG